MMSSEEDNQIELSGFPKEISIKIGLFVCLFLIRANIIESIKTTVTQKNMAANNNYC